jgi:xanthine dehydrogenase YagT iron-sulfur-binding subunit
MHFDINSRSYEVDLDARTSVLDLLRDHLGLSGTKKGCDQARAVRAQFWSTANV